MGGRRPYPAVCIYYTHTGIHVILTGGSMVLHPVFVTLVYAYTRMYDSDTMDPLLVNRKCPNKAVPTRLTMRRNEIYRLYVKTPRF